MAWDKYSHQKTADAYMVVNYVIIWLAKYWWINPEE